MPAPAQVRDVTGDGVAIAGHLGLSLDILEADEEHLVAEPEREVFQRKGGRGSTLSEVLKPSSKKLWMCLPAALHIARKSPEGPAMVISYMDNGLRWASIHVIAEATLDHCCDKTGRLSLAPFQLSEKNKKIVDQERRVCRSALGCVHGADGTDGVSLAFPPSGPLHPPRSD